jgi:tetratricopeptide (TPR) repeat protein
MILPSFLGRQGRAKDALDVCEPLWSDRNELDALVEVCVRVLFEGKHKADPAQTDRVAKWLEKALADPENQRSVRLLVGLGDVRQRQEDYEKAIEMYARAAELGDDKGTAPSTLPLVATAHNNLAWLMALKDDNLQEALNHINRAIALGTPQQQPEFLDTRGVVHLIAGDTQHAINDLERAVGVVPSPPKYFHLAQAHLRDKNREKAKQILDKAKITGWEESGLHALEKEAYQKMLDELRGL